VPIVLHKGAPVLQSRRDLYPIVSIVLGVPKMQSLVSAAKAKEAKHGAVGDWLA
jgi:hypothetical protein